MYVTGCKSEHVVQGTRCNSPMPGDFRYEGCGAFCKTDKAQNHCKFCKCRACTFCASSKATGTSTLAAQGQAKAVKKKKSGAVREVASASALGASVADAKVTCISGLKGDFNFQTCGAFCKPSKATNHCKFCKCKSCTFCGGSVRSRQPVLPNVTPDSAIVKPRDESPSMPSSPHAARRIAPSVSSEPSGLGSKLGGLVLLFIIICGVAACCSDSEELRRLFRICAQFQREKRDEGEAFLGQQREGQEHRVNGEMLHPGLELDAVFKHVEELEANIRRKHAQ